MLLLHQSAVDQAQIIRSLNTLPLVSCLREYVVVGSLTMGGHIVGQTISEPARRPQGRHSKVCQI